MDYVYVVIETDAHPVVFARFADAKASVLEKYRETLQEEADGSSMASEVNVEESDTGVTYLYIEKGINIYIYRLPILASTAFTPKGLLHIQVDEKSTKQYTDHRFRGEETDQL